MSRPLALPMLVRQLPTQLPRLSAIHLDGGVVGAVSAIVLAITLIMAVRDQESFDQVLRHGWERLNNSPTQEHSAALIEIAKIAAHRFDRLVADANPIHSARVPHLDN